MSRHVTQMEIGDCPMYTPERRAEIIASYPEYLREAKAKGIPVMGSGRVFPVSESMILIEPIQIPKHWPQINGLDFGWDHPFAAVNLAYDRDSDCVYVCKEYRESKATPIIHSAAVKPWGSWIPCAWPHDGYQHDKGSGDQLSEQYRAQGLNMLREHATHQEGGFGIEAGIADMLDRMQTSRFKVFSTLHMWFEEFRLYHREKNDKTESKIVKIRDDLMSATRIGVMMLRRAKVKFSNQAEFREMPVA